MTSDVEGLPLPPQHLHDLITTPGLPVRDATRDGQLTATVLAALAGLERGSAVLEIGCGWGRNARILSTVLDAARGGRYAGFDIQPALIDWANANLQRDNAKFALVQAESEHYHESHPGLRGLRGLRDGLRGLLSRASSRAQRPSDAAAPPPPDFPHPPSSFDVVFALSVFTHTKRATTTHYLREVRCLPSSRARILPIIPYALPP